MLIHHPKAKEAIHRYYEFGKCHTHLSITQAKPFAVLFSESTK